MKKSEGSFGIMQAWWLLCAAIGLLIVVVPGVKTTGLDEFLTTLSHSYSAQVLLADLLGMGLAITVFMVAEAIRLGMKMPWLWVLAACAIPGACVVPLFFFFRERKMQALALTQ
ncbi:MAG: DUF2834 domain-containing protein [Cytophagaceae bacterium]|jgi:hypothetical protein|nr:DUF2834 domain-containing protein [Cytophagaceae bacterium]